MNNCNKNGAFEHGHCVCNEGSFGADCSIVPQKLSSLSSVNLGIRGWQSFYLDSPNEFEFTITAKTVGDDTAVVPNLVVYTREGDVPTLSNFDTKQTGSSFSIQKPSSGNK